MDILAEKYAEATGRDFEEVMDRWRGRPDLIAEDLFQVRDSTTRQPRPLKLYKPYQRTAMEAYFYGDSSTINVYKGRRIGMTFIFLLCITIDALSHPHTFYPVLCPSGKDAKKRIDDIYDIIEMCVLDITSEDMPVDNTDKITFWNGSTIEAFTGGADSGRGDDPAKCVFIDEMAFLEDQERTLRAFRAFISLGEGKKMIQVSTPKVDNDVFMETHRRGTITGYATEDGEVVKRTHPEATPVPISIKQPSFKNADEIDIRKPLTLQDVEPVRPDLSIETVEDERASDPQGFAQEYLCRPISDEYRFFTKDGIERAMSRGRDDNYAYGFGVGPQEGGMMVMGVDIGMDHDDTVISVFECVGDVRRGKRYHRYLEVVNDEALRESGIIDGDRSNVNHVAQRVGDVARACGCEHVIYDATTYGRPFKSVLREQIGRGLHPFNFSDQDSVAQMAADLNNGLHNDRVTLIPDEIFESQLKAVMKIQKEDYNKPKFTGKENGPEGKDDMAMATILAAYPYHLATESRNGLQQADDPVPAVPAEGGSVEARPTRRLQSGSASTVDEYMGTATGEMLGGKAFGSTRSTRRSQGARRGRRSYRR